MKITKNIVTREEAAKLAPAYVKRVENPSDGKAWDAVDAELQKLKCGQAVITHVKGVYVRARVSSIRWSRMSEDGPVIRVGNGEWTWRVDGDEMAYPL